VLSAITVYLVVCLITKCLIFLQVIRVFYIFVNECSKTNAKVFKGSTMTKRLKSTALEPHLIIFEVSHTFVTNYVQTCFQWIKFLRHVQYMAPFLRVFLGHIKSTVLYTLVYNKEQISHKKTRGPQKRGARSSCYICYYC